MALKPDMSKTYNRVEWYFIREVINKMGFARRWIDLIMQCISSVSYSILLNGRLGNVFARVRVCGKVTLWVLFFFLSVARVFHLLCV